MRHREAYACVCCRGGCSSLKEPRVHSELDGDVPLDEVVGPPLSTMKLNS